MNDNIVLSVRDLEVNFYNNERCNRVLRGVSFQLQKGKIMCIVGESGCGKSVTANSIMGLLPDLSRIEKGEIHFFHNGRDIRIDQLKRKGKEMRQIRGDGISMIFQDPMTALNPVFTVGYQINESLLYHDRAKTKSEAKQKAIRLLKDMGIPLPEKRVDEYPYQFSGGMCQRAMIAMAMSCQPKVLIADEPTTALDVTVQAQVLDLLKELRDKYGTAILLITHNLGVVWDMCDSVIVMYAGKTVEYAPCIDLYNHPLHPYTWGLLDCMPRLSSNSKEELSTIAGTPPDLRLTGVGCNFANRCPYAQERCRTEVPELTEVSPGHRVACHRQTGGNRLVRNEVTESGR
jgi:oligopeptide/dipeptide ABC transporter ATP-binding protein